MNPLFLDVETSKAPRCDPFCPSGKLMYIGVDDGNSYVDCAIEFHDDPYVGSLALIQKFVDACDVVVGANIKFDISWCRRYGISLDNKTVWDVLLIQFILNHQTTPFVSLNDVAEIYGIGQKLDIVKTEYWDNGIDTDKVPEQILRDYLQQDVALTKQIYELQYAEVIKRGIMPLIRLHNQDLLVLEEMEWNGNYYNVTASRNMAAQTLLKIRQIKRKLNELTPIKPKCWSTDFISLLLYGGTYKYVVKEPYIFTYKDGSSREKIHNVVKEVSLPQLCRPPHTERKKAGYWPTDEDTLKKLKVSGNARKVVASLLELRELEKLVGTYYKGFPKRIRESGWENNMIHTNFSQTTAVTGRLASSKPNCQNVGAKTKEFFISRFN